ncbi:Armadillo repeat-containing protein 4 [Armadillidium vulgare]|nr:Armadillo repeat-containing protein 4 [Armadillidium vulgare]
MASTLLNNVTIFFLNYTMISQLTKIYYFKFLICSKYVFVEFTYIGRELFYLVLPPYLLSVRRVVTNVVGAIGEVVVLPECCSLVVHGDGVVRLLELLQSNSDKLLLNVAKALDSCAKNGEALDQLLEKEGLRLLWSHLKSPNEKIQASAANAICTCLRQEKEGLAEVVRSLVGGIELLVALLESPCEACTFVSLRSNSSNCG